MLGISASSPSDVWAVGTTIDQFNPPVLHWDGTIWRVQRPTPGGDINAVEAIASDDVWAVGTAPHPLALHWDGATWARTRFPEPADDTQVYAVSAVASDDVWAVGHYRPGPIHALTAHWDGARWTRIPAPDASTTNVFYGVAAIALDDAWAVGYFDAGADGFQPLAEHWDGTAWSIATLPSFQGTENILYDVSAVSATDVWAVGSIGPPTVPVTLHWDGVQWGDVPAPSGGDNGSFLEDVSAISATDAWAVGRLFSSQGPLFQPFTLHWDGIVWIQVPAPYPNGEEASFSSVAATAPDDIWALGWSDSVQGAVLVEHSRGVCS